MRPQAVESRRAPAPFSFSSFVALVALLAGALAGCGGRGSAPSAAGSGGSARGAVSLERVTARSGPGEGFPAAGSLRRGEAVFVLGSERGFVHLRRGAADGPEVWIPLGALETEAGREAREKRAAAARGIAGEPASAGPAGATVLLAPDWGAARWGALADGESVLVLYAAHDFLAVRLSQLSLGFVPARDVRLLGVPFPAEPAAGEPEVPGAAPPASGPGSPGLPGSGPAAARRGDLPAGIPASGFEPEPVPPGPLDALPPGSEAPVLRTRTDPRYPEAARRAGISGEVVLRVVVEADGTAGRVQVLAGAPFGLTEAAEEAVRKWTWNPARAGSRPFAVWKTLRVRFESPASAAPAPGPGGATPDRPL